MGGRKRFLVLALVSAVFAPCAVRAEVVESTAGKAAEAQKAFDEVFGADVKRVKSTRDTRDDVELAARLLTAAKEASATPEFALLLCEKAYELAMANPDGFQTAFAAMELESARFPDKADTCNDQILEIRQKQFDLAKGSARAKAGEALIDALMAAVDSKAASLDPAAALPLCRRAQTVARLVNSETKSAVDARLASLGQLAKLVREADELKKQLDADAQNVAVREKLVRLCLVDMDSPAEAAKYVEGVADESLRKYVPAAVKALDAVPELACTEMADWYKALADSASPAAKGAMLVRAQAYYQRFLGLHETADISRIKAAMLLKKVEEDLKRVASPDARPVRLRITPLPELSMKPFPVGHKEMFFPAQETVDLLAPFAGKPIYFNQHTGKNVVYEVRSPKALSQLYFKGAAMFKLTFEILDLDGKTVAKGGPYEGGNKWGEFTLEFPPRRIFRLKVHNEAGNWLFINNLTFK